MVVLPLQGHGLVHLQSLGLLLDCLRLYAGLGSSLKDQGQDGSTPRQSTARLDKLLTLLVTAEARSSAMRLLLLASNPAVGRPDYVSAVQGGHIYSRLFSASYSGA